MEYMESKMQDQMEGWDAHTETTYDMGIQAGLLQAAAILREAGIQSGKQAEDYKSIAQSEGLRFAGRILTSWANGLEMKANGYVEAREGERALRGARK